MNLKNSPPRPAPPAPRGGGGGGGVGVGVFLLGDVSQGSNLVVRLGSRNFSLLSCLVGPLNEGFCFLFWFVCLFVLCDEHSD